MRGIGAILEQKVIGEQLLPAIPTNINLLELVGVELPEIPTSIGAEYIEVAEIPTNIQLIELISSTITSYDTNTVYYEQTSYI